MVHQCSVWEQNSWSHTYPGGFPRLGLQKSHLLPSSRLDLMHYLEVWLSSSSANRRSRVLLELQGEYRLCPPTRFLLWQMRVSPGDHLILNHLYQLRTRNRNRPSSCCCPER